MRKLEVYTDDVTDDKYVPGGDTVILTLQIR